MKKISIIALHLAFGGIEKAICSMANLFADNYEVEIICVYNMPDSPAFPLDNRVKLRYLLDDIPNRAQWHAALSAHAPVALAKESLRSVKILAAKKTGVIRAIKECGSDVIITTRHEDNLLLSRYGRKEQLKIAQLHHDHKFEKTYLDAFKNGYKGIDVLAMLTPGLRDEAAEAMRGHNAGTRPVYIPNFLEHFPECVRLDGREKTVLAVGRLNPVKRFDLLVRQFAALHADHGDWKLKIVGEGEEREKIEKTIDELDAHGYVILTGRMDSAGVEQEMLKASFLAMTSSSEGFPFVLLEAQSCGLPIAAYDVRVGPGFVVHDGIDGFLAANDEEFRSRLDLLMSAPELRQKMADAAVKSAAEFSKEKVREIWTSVIED